MTLTNELECDIYELPLVPGDCPHVGPGDHTPPPPVHLVGVHVLLSQDVTANGLELGHVTVQGVAADQVKLVENLLTNLRGDLEHIVMILLVAKFRFRTCFKKNESSQSELCSC